MFSNAERNKFLKINKILPLLSGYIVSIIFSINLNKTFFKYLFNQGVVLYILVFHYYKTLLEIFLFIS